MSSAEWSVLGIVCNDEIISSQTSYVNLATELAYAGSIRQLYLLDQEPFDQTANPFR